MLEPITREQWANIIETYKRYRDRSRASVQENNRMCGMVRRIYEAHGATLKPDDAAKIVGKLCKFFKDHSESDSHNIFDYLDELVMACHDFYAMKCIADKAKGPYLRKLGKLTRELPIWTEWGVHIRGLGEAGLGEILAEARDLNRFAQGIADSQSNGGEPNQDAGDSHNESGVEGLRRLWKRMGLGLVNNGAEIQRRCKDKAEEHGYCPRRRAVMWNIGSALIRSGKAVQSTFYVMYMKRKGYEKTKPDISDLHAHRRAQRYIEKELLKSMWNAWFELYPVRFGNNS